MSATTRCTGALAVALALAAVPLAARAQIPPRTGEGLTVHPEARTAIQGIRSPFCPGQMLEVCTSSQAAVLRNDIQRMAEAGLVGDSIVELVVAQYGEQWRAEPLRRGTGLLAWVVPPVGLLLALGMVALVLAQRRRGPAPVVSVDVSPAVEARLKAALKELDEAEEPDW